MDMHRSYEDPSILPMPALQAQVSSSSTVSSSWFCPAKAVAKRLNQFEQSWTNSVNTSVSSDTKNTTNTSPEFNDNHENNKPTLQFHESDLLISTILGNGAFSTVHRVYIRQGAGDGSTYSSMRSSKAGQGGRQFESEQSFAMKKLRSSRTGGERFCTTTATSDFALETKILQNLHHENIIQLIGIKAGDMIQSLKEGNFFIVLEEMVETLDLRLKRWKANKNKQFWSTQSIATSLRLREVAIGIASGMEYLHSRKIMFRDLKPNNIGFDACGKVKIFDFGLAREYTLDSTGNNTVKPRRMTGGTGTLRYMAPEVARMEQHHSYGLAADVYSFAILLWQILTNRVPYRKFKSREKFETKVYLGTKRPNLKYIDSELLKNLISSAWSPHPASRPTFAIIKRKLQRIVETSGRPSFLGRTNSSLSLFSTTSSVLLTKKLKTRKTFAAFLMRRVTGYADAGEQLLQPSRTRNKELKRRQQTNTLDLQELEPPLSTFQTIVHAMPDNTENSLSTMQENGSNSITADTRSKSVNKIKREKKKKYIYIPKQHEDGSQKQSSESASLSHVDKNPNASIDPTGVQKQHQEPMPKKKIFLRRGLTLTMDDSERLSLVSPQRRST